MKPLTRIALLCAVLTAFLYASACAVNDASSVQVTSKPTVSGYGVGGHEITADDLNSLAEIAVPVRVSFTTPTNVKLFASFYDGNDKYIGMGVASLTIDSQTALVMIPVENAVTGAETLKIAVTDANFRPLSVFRYSLTGGGGSSGGLDHENETPVLSGAIERGD